MFYISFVTGASFIPSMGFYRPPQIIFGHNAHYPTASNCVPSLANDPQFCERDISIQFKDDRGNSGSSWIWQFRLDKSMYDRVVRTDTVLCVLYVWYGGMLHRIYLIIQHVLYSEQWVLCWFLARLVLHCTNFELWPRPDFTFWLYSYEKGKMTICNQVWDILWCLFALHAPES